MLVNQKRRSKRKLTSIFLLIVSVFMVTSASAATKYSTANLNGSSVTAKGTQIKATKNGTGSLYTVNNGANTTVYGYSKRKNTIGSTTVASSGWINPGRTSTKSFSYQKGKEYFSTITGQTLRARGGARTTVH